MTGPLPHPVNANGLTLTRWLYAAGYGLEMSHSRPVSDVLLAAWEAGEDPAGHRAEAPKRIA